MSYLDNQQGFFDGAAATARRYNAAIDGWEAQANDLQRRLKQASAHAEELAKKRLFTEAQLEGQTALMRTLKDALAILSPNHPLLEDDSRQVNIQRAAMAKFLAEHGYHFDPKTREVRKLGK